MEAAKEAAAAWIDAALDAGAPHPSAVAPGRSPRTSRIRRLSLGIVELDPALFDDSIERVNITLPKRVLRRLAISPPPAI